MLWYTDRLIVILLKYQQSSIKDAVIADGLIFLSYGYFSSGRKSMSQRITFSSKSMATTTGQAVGKTLVERGVVDNADAEIQVSVMDLIPRVRPVSEEPEIFEPKARTVVGAGSSHRKASGLVHGQDPHVSEIPEYNMKHDLLHEWNK
jgi:hypothetical protein